MASAKGLTSPGSQGNPMIIWSQDLIGPDLRKDNFDAGQPCGSTMRHTGGLV
jgi:hypothetical protein